tara:strand:+ start:204 stop:545 length:342 start_codon:yes stop_codon:yes gene_type:complete
MIKIYHNNRCQKSRMGLKLLQAQGCNFKIIDYIKNPIGADTLKTILKALDIPAIDLVRTQESIWKSEFKGKALSESQIINALVKHPKLIKRPIVINGQKAVVGRPTEKINKVL